MGFETAVFIFREWAGPIFFFHLKLFVLHMESDEVSIFLFLFPVQTVKNKSKAPDIILLQQWGDVFILWNTW